MSSKWNQGSDELSGTYYRRRKKTFWLPPLPPMPETSGDLEAQRSFQCAKITGRRKKSVIWLTFGFQIPTHLPKKNWTGERVQRAGALVSLEGGPRFDSGLFLRDSHIGNFMVQGPCTSRTCSLVQGHGYEDRSEIASLQTSSISSNETLLVQLWIWALWSL